MSGMSDGNGLDIPLGQVYGVDMFGELNYISTGLSDMGRTPECY